MVANVQVHSRGETPFIQFLEDHDFEVQQITDSVIQASRIDELPVFINHKDGQLYFEVDLAATNEIGSKELYYKLLDINTQILPLSVGIDSTDPDNPKLVLVESRESQNLDENEILSVLNAFELAIDKIENILTDHV